MMTAPLLSWRGLHEKVLRLAILLLFLSSLTACDDDILPHEGNSGEADAGDVNDLNDVDDFDAQEPDDADHPGDEDTPGPPPERDVHDGDGGDEDPDADDPADPVELNLLAVYPSQGPRSGGTPFILDGEGFTHQTQVLFGSTAVAVDLIDGKLNGVTPPSLGLGPVSIRAFDDENGDHILVDAFTYVEPLIIEAVQPARATVDGGVQLSITGQGFSPDAKITIGGRPVMDQTFLSSTQIRAIAPPHPEGTADLRITDQNNSHTLYNGVEYIAPISLTAVIPPAGSTLGGDTVQLKGARFGPDLQVFFGQEQATVLQVDPTGQEATLITPPHSAGLVHVNVQSGGEGATLAEGFGYFDQAPAAPSFVGALPDRGHTAGGQEVYLLGSFPSSEEPRVFFGDEQATLIEADQGMLLVETPAAAPGPVDITVHLADQSLVLPEGFRFYQPLHIDSLSPTEGDSQGGTTVTVKGDGFEAAQELTLGGKSIPFTVVDDETIEFTTPPAAGGAADLVIYDVEQERHILEEAFFYLDELQLWSLAPTRGATAGGTYVVLRGQGFRADTQVFFGQREATEVELIDPFNLAVRTPAHSSGNVTVTAQNSPDEQAIAPEPYTYFNPGSPSGGAWGNPIDGAVNIIVFSSASLPVEGAFVMLSTNAQTSYAGLTDENGMITLSGPDVYGEQTITAVAAEHSSTTIQRVNAENITIFLEGPPEEGEGAFPPPPPTATFTGHIEGLDKIERPSSTQVLLARVYSTRPRLNAQIPDPGFDNTVLEDGQFTITTRVGNLALVAIGGLYDTADGSFTPLRMGVVRHLYAADSGHYEVDIELNIPLNRTLQIKYTDPPLASPGPDQIEAELHLDLGLDGVYGPFEELYITDSSLHSLDYVAPLIGDIADASYTVVATTSTGGSIPFVETRLQGIDDLSKIHTTKPLTSTIDITTPAGLGQAPRNGLVQWELHGLHEPDFYYIILEDPMGETLWEIFLNGSARSFRFPDFPDFSDFGMEDLPLPYPGGLYILAIFGISKDGTSAHNFSYADLDPSTFNSYSVHQTIISL